jgi:hypothetical protein
MPETTRSIASTARRQALRAALGVTAAAIVATPAAGQSVHAQKTRLRLEGDVPSFDWALSLYSPPAFAGGLPPGTVARVSYQYPTPYATRNSSLASRIMAVRAFLAPAGVPPGAPAPEIVPISTFDIAIDEVLVASAVFAEDATRPRSNVGILGRIVANDIESPFGSLVDRVFAMTFGFTWTDAGDNAVFKLVLGSAAGSHVTVVPHAAGEISFR